MKRYFWVPLSYLQDGDIFEVDVDGVRTTLRKVNRTKGRELRAFGDSIAAPRSVIMPSETLVRIEVQ